ncbi:Cof-type HAD-IIB family hydrolase [Bacillus horti]|uniref:Cof subfamily protein (Haloacid dehalogenase superfamily) n=1 Tax=Caldalkalibacillus horti TaxID=77523 RepID=A0ABT9VUD1_9BACI|nr:Cof-type HAD-IIB family hydrolase [Bacillus horti]MDQ0164579.1 Cof subfamily protein (haloacid dehalogenase superfamily) [Bacillus horti]
MFSIATGRIKSSVMNYVHQLPINVPGILYNGGLVYDFNQDKPLWNSSLPDEIYGIVPMLQQQFPELGIEIYSDEKAYFIQENAITDLHKSKESITICYDPVDQIASPWEKIILVWDPEKLEKVEQFLQVLQLPMHLVRSESFFLEILPKGVSKGSALQHLFRESDLNPKYVVAIGDNMNDFELLQEAEIGVAVENAHPRLKEAADVITVHHNQHAIAAIIKDMQQLLAESSKVEKKKIAF